MPYSVSRLFLFNQRLMHNASTVGASVAMVVLPSGADVPILHPQALAAPVEAAIDPNSPTKLTDDPPPDVAADVWAGACVPWSLRFLIAAATEPIHRIEGAVIAGAKDVEVADRHFEHADLNKRESVAIFMGIPMGRKYMCRSWQHVVESIPQNAGVTVHYALKGHSVGHAVALWRGTEGETDWFCFFDSNEGAVQTVATSDGEATPAEAIAADIERRHPGHTIKPRPDEEVVQVSQTLWMKPPTFYVHAMAEVSSVPAEAGIDP